MAGWRTGNVPDDFNLNFGSGGSGDGGDGTSVYFYGQEYLTWLPWFGRYDPVSDTWTQLTDYGSWRYFHSTAVYGGKVYLFAGIEGASGVASGGDVYSTKIYDIASDTWDADGADMPEVDAGDYREQACAVVFGSTIYVVGGFGSGTNATFNNRMDSYDPAGDSWTRLADMPDGQDQGAAAGIVSRDEVHAIACNIDGTQFREHQVYTPSLDTWAELSLTPNQDDRGNNWRMQIGGVLLHPVTGELWAVTGTDPGPPHHYDIVGRYEPSASSWSFGPHSPNTGTVGPWVSAVVGSSLVFVDTYEVLIYDFGALGYWDS